MYILIIFLVHCSLSIVHRTKLPYLYHFQTDTRKTASSQNSRQRGTNLPRMITERLFILFIMSTISCPFEPKRHISCFYSGNTK